MEISCQLPKEDCRNFGVILSVTSEVPLSIFLRRHCSLSIVIVWLLFHVLCDLIAQALESGQLRQGGIVTEGSAGSTATSIATVAPAYGCKCHVVIPDDAAIEKVYLIIVI